MRYLCVIVLLIGAVAISPGLLLGQEPAKPKSPITFEEVPTSVSKITWVHDNGRSEARHLPETCGGGGLFLDFEMERGADGAMTGYAFPELLIDVVKLSKAGKRDAAHDLFDAHLPLIRYEQQPGAGLAVRKYVLQKRGIIASSAQRKPGATITAKAKAEVDYLLSRVARVDKRANLQPQASAAE